MTIKIKSKTDYVVDAFIDMILEGKYNPGDKLPIEDSLSDFFGVSRVTIREAFKKLSVMGIVNIRQGDGTYVNEVSPENFMKPLLPMIMLSPMDIEKLYDVRKAIECGAVESAAINRSEEDIEILLSCQKMMKTHFDNYSEISKKEYAKADREFHIAIINASNNIYYSQIFDAIYNVLVSGIEKTSRMNKGRDASITEHSKIIDAIINKEDKLAKEYMSEHLENAKKFYLERITQ